MLNHAGQRDAADWLRRHSWRRRRRRRHARRQHEALAAGTFLFAESRFNYGCRGGCLSVEDKQAVGTLSDGSAGFRQDAAAAVAQMLGAGTSALVEISVKCRGLPDRDVLRWAG